MSIDPSYRQVRGCVEDVPVPEYRWASARAYEAFRDIKYGVRIHWGLYSIEGLPGESWPFLTMPNSQKQRYQEAYRTWNPAGFDADAWRGNYLAPGGPAAIRELAQSAAYIGEHHFPGG